jgi:MscS family membrane protein
VAAEYLDLRRFNSARRLQEGPHLARELCSLLDRNKRFEVRSLSDSPTGNTEDGLTPDVDSLASFELNGEPVVLHLERVNENGAGVWLVSSDSVSDIPQLSVLNQANDIEKKLPAPLVGIQLLGTPLWIWLALVLIAIMLSLVSRWLALLLLAIAKPIASRYFKTLQRARLEAMVEPLRMIGSVLVFRAAMEFVTPGALLRDYILKLLILLFILGAASLVMRIVDVISDTITSRFDQRERALSYSILPLGVRFTKICLFCIAVLIVLEQWGYKTNTILAGLGVGGLAVALAAQKTIENLFGGISVISDRPVLVGDFCQFGGQVGTVEDIGLRSTRIRTLDRTVVTVPNSQFSTMTLENFSKRDRMWFHPTLRLRRGTTAEQVRQVMQAFTEILQKHERIDASGVPLRFTKINDQSLDIDIFAYVLTADYNEYLGVQTELLLAFMESATAIGVGFATPIQESFNVALAPGQRALGGTYVPPIPESGDGSNSRPS